MSRGIPAEKLVTTASAANAAAAARLARVASRKLAVLSEKARNTALEIAATRLDQNADKIVAANAEDVRAA